MSNTAVTGIITTHVPNIGRVANLALAARIPVDGWQIGNDICNGAFAAVVCLEAARMLKSKPANEWSIREAYKEALAFLALAGTPK